MFVIAAVSSFAKQPEPCGQLFARWLNVVDPGKRFFDVLMNASTSWGWIGVAGRSDCRHAMSLDGSSAAELFLDGLVLNKSLVSQIRNGSAQAGFLERLGDSEGQFAYAVVGLEASRQTFECGNGPLGIVPLFADSLTAPTIVSNYASLCGLLGGGTALEPSTVLDFATKDSVLPQASMIRGVSKLPRGSRIELTDGRLCIKQQGSAELTCGRTSMDEACQSLLDSTTVLGDYPGQPLVALTGGRDSRLMLAILKKTGLPIELATHNHPCLDSTVAGKLAQSAGIRHWQIPGNRSLNSMSLFNFATWLPLSEGFLLPPILDEAYTVHMLAALRGMIHVGGLGGEVIRSYWDETTSGFTSPEQAIETRFFNRVNEPMYPSDSRRSACMEEWMALARGYSDPDPFVGLQVAYLDARLRGVIAARLNASYGRYSWPLANQALYRMALAMPRSQRQKADVFEELIRRFAPGLEQVQWAAGTAGVVPTRGMIGLYYKTRSRLSAVSALHKIRSAFSRGHDPRQEMIWNFIVQDQTRQWLRQFVSGRGVELLSLKSRSYSKAAERLFSLFWFDRFLAQLRSEDEAGDWRSEAVATIQGWVPAN